ncbi:MAG: hypothetical protein LBB41_02525 [Prevotellaceae bacterium]|jgi:hypothetical protein|nr:hypothetical protein [Prevotellaceae bacterium]
MKKKSILLTVAAAFCLLSTYAQPRAVGVRFGANSAELTFHQLMNSESNLLEIDFGTSWHSSLQGAVTYNWTSTTSSGDWTTYAGLGFGGGYTWGDNSWYSSNSSPSLTDIANGEYWFLRDYWTAGAVGLVGIEYKIPNTPIAVSLDYRPLIGFDFGTKSNTQKFGIQYHIPGLWNFGLSARFMLNE